MYQNDRGSYRTNESTFKQFRHSCLGKIVIALAVLLLILFIAWLTNPSPKKMKAEMEDNIKQSIWSRDSINADAMDIFVSNIGHTFTSFDEEVTEDMKQRWKLFINSNDTTYYHHWFASSMYIRHRYDQRDVRCGIGIFGLVIPLVDFNKFIPRETPIPEYDDKPLIQGGDDEEYFGETHVDIFRYEGE
ncbi:MAG: hypothetical protein IJ570_07365 [Prevotella sp.]|nr:hypothetical protein [Prevotella sp.]